MLLTLLIVAAYGVLVFGWLLSASMYRRIHRVEVKWWAIPLTHGALLFAKRLGPRCEKPLKNRRPFINQGCCRTPDRCMYPTGCVLDFKNLRERS